MNQTLTAVIASAIVSLAIVVSGASVANHTTVQYGAAPGGDFYQPVSFNSGYTVSNAVATTSAGSQTVTATEFGKWSDSSVVSFVPQLGGVTITLPASSTIPFVVPKTGDRKQFCIRNATTTASTLMTLAGGTGTNLVVASSSATAVGSVALLTGKVACITLVREAATASSYDIDALITVFK